MTMTKWKSASEKDCTSERLIGDWDWPTVVSWPFDTTDWMIGESWTVKLQRVVEQTFAVPKETGSMGYNFRSATRASY